MNHRTAIDLLDRYLTSYDAGFAMPDTGEEGRWFEWVRDYIYDSERLLTLRNHYSQLDWAARCGYAIVERKEGIRISLADIGFERSVYYVQVAPPPLRCYGTVHAEYDDRQILLDPLPPPRASGSLPSFNVEEPWFPPAVTRSVSRSR